MVHQLPILLGITALAAASPLGINAAPHNNLKRLENGVGRTPPLGWNSWNQAQCNAATAATALATANAFVSLGLRELGYTYINIDDCWSLKSRNSSTGALVADPAKFPQGIPGLASKIHSLGLKLGLYGDAGLLTCAGYPGSYQHEQQDADTLAAWGVDYWKYDNCLTEQPYTNNGIKSPQYYPIMRDALLKTKKPILFSICQWGRDEVWKWGASVGNIWRMSEDITNDWASVASIAARAATMAEYAGPGGFNDLDMMELGNGKLSEQEERTHFGLWAIMKSPIILGTDVTKIKAGTLAVVKNKGLLAVNQDPLGKAATTYTPKGQAGPLSGKLYTHWAGPLSGGAVVIGLVAPDGAATLTANFADVPGLGEGTFSWVELWSGRNGTGTSVTQKLDKHDSAFFRVSKVVA